MLLARALGWLAAFTLSGVPVFASPASLGKPHRHGRDSKLLGPRAQVQTRTSRSPDPRVLDEVLGALKVLQDNYFEPWKGTWPDAIDWTAAVIGTQVSGALSSLSHALAAGDEDSDKDRENLIALYFSQMLGFYFGQNDIALRAQAYDDMLWVVLGWLETVKFVNLHSHLYYPSGSPRLLPGQQQLLDQVTGKAYFGNIWTPAFAHRSRIFWELAYKGWDTKWCGGGMNWNPHAQTYKNAITNELFIAASVSMYRYFPGDDNESPFSLPGGRHGPHAKHDQKYLDAAVNGYVWLRKSGMQNGPGQDPEGLYVDGFHISGWGDPNSNNTACDARNSMVYTYNQGVILTGLRGLWAVKGDESYITEGHHLIRSTIKATGYDLDKDRPMDNIGDLKPGELPPWRGMGRAGVLEDQCDVSGSCSQDSQTFKGIFFHHLITFCGTLEEDSSASESLRATHSSSCKSYRGWVEHNAKAAQATRDAKGRFGMWWTAGLLDIVVEDLKTVKPRSSSPGAVAEEESVDYRTYGVPDTLEWVPQGGARRPSLGDQMAESAEEDAGAEREPAGGFMDQVAFSVQGGRRKGSDPNDRGRGRTVETQAGGLAALRAVWELSNLG
ncbi:hypothetical protein RB594_000496 [Gaeumannomyces avenae]